MHTNAIGWYIPWVYCSVCGGISHFACHVELGGIFWLCCHGTFKFVVSISFFFFLLGTGINVVFSTDETFTEVVC